MNAENEVEATQTQETSVLIVGGSLVGLSAAVFLAWRGVPVMVVEKHVASSPHPRAIGYTPRTMELFNTVGLGERIPQSPRSGPRGPRRIRVESLTGEWHEEAEWTPNAALKAAAPRATVEYSPHTNAGIAQDRLEPILRDRATELGADIRMSTRLLSFEQDVDGVTATLQSDENTPYTLRADYLIAADGNRSPVREALGIERHGKGLLRAIRSILFHASFDPALQTRLDEAMAAGFRQFSINEPDLQAMFGTYGEGRWLLMFEDDVERGPEELLAAVRRVVGQPNLDIEVIATGRWEIAGLIADRFQSGRVFLAGDAAHMLPPNRGGYGANTGIQDAHNLAWKLAAVLDGTSAPSLLGTYDAERRPVAALRHDQIFARPEHAAYAGGAGNTPIIEDAAVEFGQLYRSVAVLGAGEELPIALRPDEWRGQPGTRAPHLWLTRGGDRHSTLDLFGKGWVLLAEDDRWSQAAARASEALGLNIQSLRVGTDIEPEDTQAFLAAFGLTAGGASLIRPDGYVAWRSPGLPQDPADVLTHALEQVASAARQATLAR